MRCFLLSGITLLVAHAAAQSLPTQATLARHLATSESGTDVDANVTVQGQTLQLYPFDVSVLTNESHALISFNISKPVADIGYVAVGFGSSMQDASMVLLWPSESGSNWTISHRCSSGHDDPKVSVPSGSSTPPFTIVPALSVTTASGTSVSFIRPLTLPSHQTLFSHSKYLNMTRTSNSQRLIYAFTKERPPTSSEDSDIAQHDAGSFGSTAVDLTKVFVGSTVGSWQRYDTIVMIHAGVGMLVWLVLAPAAILIGRLGRNWGSWYTWHSRIQGVVVIPATAIVVALGIYANHLGYSDILTGHKIAGFIVIMFALVQAGLGYWAHANFNPNRTSRPAFNCAHIVLGVATLLVSWLQIYLGLNDYSDRPVPTVILGIIAALGLAFVIIYLVSLFKLIFARHREGRPWFSAAAGLGRDAASARKARKGGAGGWEAQESTEEPSTPYDTSAPRYQMTRRDDDGEDLGGRRL